MSKHIKNVGLAVLFTVAFYALLNLTTDEPRIVYTQCPLTKGCTQL
jgi:hypothetical protein